MIGGGLFFFFFLAMGQWGAESKGHSDQGPLALLWEGLVTGEGEPINMIYFGISVFFCLIFMFTGGVYPFIKDSDS